MSAFEDLKSKAVEIAGLNKVGKPAPTHKVPPSQSASEQLMNEGKDPTDDQYWSVVTDPFPCDNLINGEFWKANDAIMNILFEAAMAVIESRDAKLNEVIDRVNLISASTLPPITVGTPAAGLYNPLVKL